MKRHLSIIALFTATLLVAPTADAQNVQVFNGADVNFGTWLPGDGNLSNDQFFCVFKDSGNDRWTVEANGSGAGGAFSLTDGTNTLPIDRIRITNRNMTPGVVETNRRDADNAGSADCVEFGGDNQLLRVQMRSGDLGSVPPGTYTGTLSVTATP